jgi:hypothetical protein
MKNYIWIIEALPDADISPGLSTASAIIGGTCTGLTGPPPMQAHESEIHPASPQGKNTSHPATCHIVAVATYKKLCRSRVIFPSFARGKTGLTLVLQVFQGASAAGFLYLAYSCL